MIKAARGRAQRARREDVGRGINSLGSRGWRQTHDPDNTIHKRRNRKRPCSEIAIVPTGIQPKFSDSLHNLGKKKPSDPQIARIDLGICPGARVAVEEEL